MSKRVEWRGEKYAAKVRKRVHNALDESAQLIRRETVGALRKQTSRGVARTPSVAGQPPASWSNRLWQSMAIDSSNIRHATRPSVRIGPNTPYARIQEFGGVISGKPWLKIPITLKARRADAMRNRLPGLVFIKSRSGNLLLVEPPRGLGTVHYVLKRSIRLPARPYIRPSFNAMLPRIRELFLPANLLRGL